MKASSKAIDKILELIISEHEQDASNASQKSDMDFVNVMLSLRENSTHVHDELSYAVDRSNIKAILLDMIAAAIGSSNNIIEWVMSELLKAVLKLTYLLKSRKA